MNLGMILNAPYPADMRVKKEASALLKAGFKIHLLCLRRHTEDRYEEVDGISITRIDAGKNNFQLALRDAIMSVTFKHPEFIKTLPRWVCENGIEVLHVHDLPLAGTAIAVRKKLSLKVVVDLHENYPEALRTWFAWKKGFVVKLKNRMFMNPDRWIVLERKAVNEANHVIAVVEEMATRLIQTHDVSSAKITVVSNTEEKSFQNQALDPNIYSGFVNKFKIVYSGGIGPHRGIDTAIEAMKYLKGYPAIELIIIGSGSNDVINRLKKQTEELQVTEHVHFLGHQSFARFYSFMHLADVNIIPHKSNAHTDNTVPHKLFQSMMSGKPVLVSSSDPLKRIVSATSSGLVFDANDARDCAAKIIELYNDPELCRRLGINGRAATVDGPLNWDTEQKSLVALYKRIFNEENPKRTELRI